MSSPVARSIALLALAPLVLSACTPEEPTEAACEAPTAVAGVDLSIVLGDAVTLDGSNSTVCKQAKDQGTYSYNWTFDVVPTDSSVEEGALSDNNTSSAVSPSFVPDAEGDYVISLTVSDIEDTSAPDLVVVHVASGDQKPVALCGDDISAQEDTRVELDGSESYDPEGAELTYSWSLATVPDCSDIDSSNIYNSGGPNPALVPDCEGLYIVSLVVGDGALWSEPDYCTIDVASGNRVPVADAGASGDLPACTDNPMQLDGWGSYDPDGDELTYQWTVVSVPGSSASTDDDFDDATLPNAQFTWDVVGAYTFQLQVSDGQAWSSPDIVTYKITDGSENASPISNAGDDISIASTADCTSASYVWTCEDCPAESAELDGSDSYDENGDLLSFYWSESTGTCSFSNPYSEITDVIVPDQPAEYGTDSTTVFEVTLSVADCLESDNDIVNVTYTCTGESGT